MTRETKIGLLVGLAFIIVIGILLSDHLTNSTEAPPATLAEAGPNARQAVNTPGGTQPPITRVVAPQGITPQQQVLTPRDLQQPPISSAIVQIGGPSAPAPQNPPVMTQTPVADGSAAVQFIREQQAQPVMQQPAPQPPVAVNSQQPMPGADTPEGVLARIAQQHGESLVTMNPNGQQQVITGVSNTSAAGTKEYTAQAGDSVSRMAGKFYGSAGKAACDMIINANPTLKANPNLVVAGRIYKIPAAATSTPAPSSVVQTVLAPIPAAARQAPSSTEYWYTVKPGDSLWKISNDQLGKGGAGVAAIKELNKDVLSGGDIVQPNMRLRLPGKPVAQAN